MYLFEVRTKEDNIMERTGLSVDVFRDAAFNGCDCTAGGITSKVNSLVLVDEKICAPFTVREGEVYLVLEKKPIGGGEIHLRAIPMVDGRRVNDDKEGVTMFGGNFIYTSDGRFPSKYPIPVHDRFEDWETYEALSR